ALAPGTKLRHTAVMRPVFTAPLALGLIAAVTTPVQAATVYVRAGRLVDPEAGKVLERQVLRVEDGRIAAVTPEGGAALPAGASVID
ncbi:hypothetical protein AAER21_00005, partial [Pseudomonas aeruginosa]